MKNLRFVRYVKNGCRQLGLKFKGGTSVYTVDGCPRVEVELASDDLDDDKIAEGAQLALDLAATFAAPTRARRTARAPNYAQGRQRLEDRGAAALAADDAYPSPPNAHHHVRVYYRSEGGEVLCFDVGPMRAVSAQNACHAAVIDKYTHAGVPDAHVWDDRDDPSPTPRRGARLVVLPSQAYEGATDVAALAEPAE